MPKEWEPEWNEALGVWTVEFSVNGQRVRRRLGIRDRSLKALARKAAEKLYRDTWDRHLAPPEPVKTGTPFYRAADGYQKAGGETRYLPRIIAHFGPDTMVEDIDEAMILAAELELYPHASPETRRRQVRVPISAVIRWSRGERRQKRADRPRTRWLAPEEAERLIEAAAKLTLPRHSTPERRTLAKIAFLLGTGCRPAECFVAEVQHFNRATRQWWIPGEHVGAGKTEGATRWVRLPERAVDLIGVLPEVGRAFLTPYGVPIVVTGESGGQMAESFNRAREAAGLGPDVVPYTLRHTWATWFYAQTRDFGGLMDLGGWLKADTANRYRKLAPDDLADRLLAHGWDFRPAQRQESGKAAPILRIVQENG